jgi:hypothetical protein
MLSQSLKVRGCYRTQRDTSKQDLDELIKLNRLFKRPFTGASQLASAVYLLFDEFCNSHCAFQGHDVGKLWLVVAFFREKCTS